MTDNHESLIHMGATAAAWAGAVATFLAVLVALFGPALDRRLRQPVLSIGSAAPLELGRAAKVVGGEAEGESLIHWLRLPVTNSGRRTAEDVRVILLRIDAPHPFGKQPPSREVKWADVNTDRGTLPPGVSRLVDIIHITRTKISEGAERRGIVSGVMPITAADSGQPDSVLWRDMVTGGYNVHVSVSAKDVRASHYVITFQLDASGDFSLNLIIWERRQRGVFRGRPTTVGRR